MIILTWDNAVDITAHRYRCGFCGAIVAADKGFKGLHDDKLIRRCLKIKLVICPSCGMATFIGTDDRYQFPSAPYGENVAHLPEEIKSLYEQARSCMKEEAYTLVGLACRKILMNIAVEKGAAENLKFIEYVEYLANKNYIPPDSQGWVDIIRTKGNDANHEIRLLEEEEAKQLIDLTQMLLKIIFEMPKAVPAPASS